MNQPNWNIDLSGPSKGLLAVLTLTGVLGLTLGITLAQTASFDRSFKQGPLFARDGEIITYTIVALNTGGSVQGVILSDTLPLYTSYVPDSCTYRLLDGPSQPCGPLVPSTRTQLWQEDFASGQGIVTTFAAQASVGTMLWPVENCAYLAWDGQRREMCATTLLNPLHVFLPIVTRNAAPQMPDLKVTALDVAPMTPSVGQPVTVTLQVQNVGQVAAGPFWVDLYDNPDPPPTRANQIWNLVCAGAWQDCYGIAWHVQGGLAPGESVTLSSLGGYEQEQTRWLGYFAQAGPHDIYAFVDSWNWGVDYGAVQESNEGLDNRRGPVSVDVAPAPLDAGIERDAAEAPVPWRPQRP